MCVCNGGWSKFKDSYSKFGEFYLKESVPWLRVVELVLKHLTLKFIYLYNVLGKYYVIIASLKSVRSLGFNVSDIYFNLHSRTVSNN